MKWGIHSGYSYAWFTPRIATDYNIEKDKFREGYVAGIIFRTPRNDYFSNSFELSFERKGIDSVQMSSEFHNTIASFRFDYLSFTIAAGIRIFKKVEIIFSPGLSFSFLLNAKASGNQIDKRYNPPKNFVIPDNYTDFVHNIDISPCASIEYHYFTNKKLGFFGEAKVSYGILPVLKNEFSVKNVFVAIMAGISYKY